MEFRKIFEHSGIVDWRAVHGHYNRARDIVMAIDERVETLTDDRERFWTRLHG